MRSLSKHRIAAAGAGLMALALLAGCSKDESTSGGTGRLVVKLTDAPFPYDSVSRVDMFVVRIDAKTADSDSADAADTDERGGWRTIATPNALINLLALQGGVTENLGAATIPTGTYRGFRMVLDPAQSSVTLRNGTVLAGNGSPGVKFPSAHRTGVKIVLDQPVEVTQDGTTLVIDFDVGRSFVMRGHSLGQQGLLFKPVVRAVGHDLTGAVHGSVTAGGSGIAGATVELLAPGTALGDTVSANVLRTARTDAAGVYAFAFVRPGSYALRVTPPSVLTAQPALVPTVTVTTQTTVDVPVVTLAP